jgi:hypothetical protein
MATKQRSPWSLVGSGLALLFVTLVLLVLAFGQIYGGFWFVLLGAVVGIVGIVLLIAGAVGLGVRAGRA